MSIDSPHWWGFETNTIIPESTTKTVLPYWIAQRHLDEARRIIADASREYAETIWEDWKPIWDFDTRLTRIVDASQSRIDNIVQAYSDTITLLNAEQELTQLAQRYKNAIIWLQWVRYLAAVNEEETQWLESHLQGVIYLESVKYLECLTKEFQKTWDMELMRIYNSFFDISWLRYVIDFREDGVVKKYERGMFVWNLESWAERI